MCFCRSTIGLFLAAAVSTGGLAVLAAKVPRKYGTIEVLLNSKERNNQNTDERHTTGNRFAR
jgi:hypothetical protein